MIKKSKPWKDPWQFKKPPKINNNKKKSKELSSPDCSNSFNYFVNAITLISNILSEFKQILIPVKKITPSMWSIQPLSKSEDFLKSCAKKHAKSSFHLLTSWTKLSLFLVLKIKSVYVKLLSSKISVIWPIPLTIFKLERQENSTSQKVSEVFSKYTKNVSLSF